MDKQNAIEIYQTQDGQTQVELRFSQDSFWLSQKQMATLFDKDSDTISLHLKHIYQEGELDESATTEESSVVRQEGQRQVTRKIKQYNLDAIISVGYRVNSTKGTQFRIWATQRLKEYLVQGYSLNQKRFEQNAQADETGRTALHYAGLNQERFEQNAQALILFEKIAKSLDLTLDAGRGLTEIISRYTQTFLWLQRYDEGLLEEPKGQAGGTLPSPEEAMQSLRRLKADLIARQEATDLFANPRAEGLAGIFGNLEQSVFGAPAYPSIESKAAHLLYFVVKNHPFSDGNKRDCKYFCVNRRLDIVNQSVFKLNDKSVQRSLPVPDRHRPFF